MHVRIVIEEVVVDAECEGTRLPVVAAEALVKACCEEALKLHAARQLPTPPKKGGE